MPYLLIRHKVANFAAWKPVYDSHKGVRDAAGLKERHLLRGIDNPYEVVILLQGEDLDKVRKFAASADLKHAMHKAGVVDRPEIQFLQ